MSLFSDKKEEKGYKGNELVKQAGTPHEYTLEEVKEFQKCMEDPKYFINNYVKIVSIDKGIIPFKTFPFQDRIIESINKNRFTICKLFRQAGKLVPLSWDIPTPSGFKKMEDIHVGDFVLGRNGKPTQVIYESEVQTPQMVEITFDTGEKVICCEDHLWTVKDRIRRTTKVPLTEEEKKRYKNKYTRFKYVDTQLTLSAKEMIERGYKGLHKSGRMQYNFYIENCKPIDLPDNDVPIDPYTFGLWLGDGYSSQPKMCGMLEDLEHYKTLTSFSDRVYAKSKNKPNLGYLRFDESTGLTTKNLKKLNVFKNKHIPWNYIFCSKETKIKLLKGLMDTDGCVYKKQGTCHLQFSRKYKGMMETIPIFLRSLGLKVTIKDREKTNSRRYSFFVSLDDFQPCTLKRKLERIPQKRIRGRYSTSRTIIDIKMIDDKIQGKCIQVDSEDSLYLVGKDFIPTHNTTVVASYCLWFGIFNQNKESMILANKLSTAKEIMGRILFFYENLPSFLKPGVKEYNKTSVTFENGSRIQCQATSPSAIRGRSIALLLIDEFAFLNKELAEEFIASSFPALSSSKESKMVLISTPYGLNHFYKIWHDSEQGLNNFVRIEGKWNEVRDQAWYDEQCKLLGNDKVKIAQELECVDGSTKVTVMTEDGDRYTLPIRELYSWMENPQEGTKISL